MFANVKNDFHVVTKANHGENTKRVAKRVVIKANLEENTNRAVTKAKLEAKHAVTKANLKVFVQYAFVVKKENVSVVGWMKKHGKLIASDSSAVNYAQPDSRPSQLSSRSNALILTL